MNKTQSEFVRELGLWDASAIVAGSMIGSGIFMVSQDVAARVGSPGWMLLVWAVSGVLTVMSAVSYAELAGMYPQAGGQYVYLREAFGPLPAFLYGWTFVLVIQSGSIAAVGVAFGKYLNLLLSLGTNTANANRVEQILGVASIAILTFINCRGVRAGKWVQNSFTSIKTLTLILLVILGLIYIQSDAALYAPFFEAKALDKTQWISLGGFDLVSAVGTAMVGTFFAADAWNNATFVAAEVKNPRRNVGLSLLLGTSAVIVLYLLVNFAYIATMSMDRIANAQSQRVVAEMMYIILGKPGELVFTLMVLISTFGCNNGIILSGGRLVYAMSQDGLFFKAAGELSPKHHVPIKALVIQGVWASILAFSGSYNELLDYVIFAALLSYVFTILGIFVLRSKKPDIERPYRAWGYPVMQIIYILAASVFLIILVTTKVGYTIRGLAIVITGIPVYFCWRWLDSRRT